MRKWRNLMTVYRSWRTGELSKYGLREEVDFAYFSTIYVLLTSKGFVSRRIDRYSFELNPDKILDCAQALHLTPGSSLSVASRAVLAIRGKSKTLLVYNVSETDTKPIKLSSSLTLGSVLKRSDNAEVLATDEVPEPISGLTGQSWDLVVGAHGLRGWKRKSNALELSAEMLALHSFVNNPY
jgi:hypothetical protein